MKNAARIINRLKKFTLVFAIVLTTLLNVAYAETFPCVVKTIETNQYYYCAFTTLNPDRVYLSFQSQILEEAAPYQTCVRPNNARHGNSIGLHMSIYSDNLDSGVHFDDIIGKTFEVNLSQQVTKWDQKGGTQTWYVLKGDSEGNYFHSSVSNTLHVSIARSLQDTETHACTWNQRKNT